MSLFAPLLISFFFFSGSAVAQISAPNCSTIWLWVRMLSFTQHTLALNWPGGLSPSHSILSGKMRVQLQRT